MEATMSDMNTERKRYIREYPCPRCGYDGLGESVEGSWTHYRKEYERAKGVIERQAAVIEAARRSVRLNHMHMGNPKWNELSDADDELLEAMCEYDGVRYDAPFCEWCEGQGRVLNGEKEVECPRCRGEGRR